MTARAQGRGPAAAVASNWPSCQMQAAIGKAKLCQAAPAEGPQAVVLCCQKPTQAAQQARGLG
jgi:hypothetical protein